MGNPAKHTEEVCLATHPMHCRTFAIKAIPRVNEAGENLRYVLSIIALLVIDFTLILLTIQLLLWLRIDVLPSLFPTVVGEFNRDSAPLFVLNGLIPVALIGFLAYEGLYTSRLPFWQGAERLFKATFFAFVGLLLLFFILGDIADKSRILFVLLWPLVFFSLAGGRWGGKKMLSRMGIWSRPILLIGAGRTAEVLMERFFCDPAVGYRVIGVLEDEPWCRPLCQTVPYLGRFDQAEEIVRKTGVREVMVTAPGLEKERLLSLIYKLQRCTRRVSFVPDLIGVPMSNLEMDTVFREQTLLVHVRNNLAVTRNRWFKRGFDLVVGSVILLFALPVLLVIALLIRLETPGAPIFVHPRLGLGGQVFPCLKFRTMVQNSDQILADLLQRDPVARDEWYRDFKLRQDPRITRLGRFLRLSSLDELPQLINVIAGQMSLVGPRPIIREEIAKYGPAIEDYYLVRPGLTGLWQISGRNNLSYEQRVEMDSWYVRNWSPWFDLMILFRTLGAVLDRKGAY